MLDTSSIESCRQQVFAWYERLVSPKLLQQDLVWHYTTGEALVSIVESGSLYSTHPSCLNDSTELRYAVKLFREALKNRLKELPPNDTAVQFGHRYVGLLSETEEVQVRVESDFFVLCFSTLRDDLTQWRSYAGGENGYAIGISPHDLLYSVSEQRRSVGRVNYDRALHESMALEIADAMLKAYRNGKPLACDSELLLWEEDFLKCWDSHLSWLSPFVKDPCFSSENEVRVLYQYKEDDNSQLIFRQKKTMLSRHLPLTWPPAFEEARSKVPITEVIVGPGRHQFISGINVAKLFKKNRYPEKVITLSRIPYQEF